MEIKNSRTRCQSITDTLLHRYISTYKYTQKNTHDPTVADHDFIFRASLIKTFAISFGRRLSTDLPASQKAQRNATQFKGAKGQTKSKRFFQAYGSSKNKQILLYYYETSGQLVFVCVLKEIEDTKKTFTN